jgi:hypothetical protein
MLNRFRLAAPQDGAATLSGDEQAMEIVMAVAGKPRFLLLDAPTGGMSLAERRTKCDGGRSGRTGQGCCATQSLCCWIEPKASGSG